jgi:hypothetical protein
MKPNNLPNNWRNFNREEAMSDEPEVAVLEPVYEVVFSATIGKLVLALSKAQLNYKAVLKQNENEAFRRGNRVSKYADLATYIDATQEALAKEELVVIQWPDVSPEAKSMTLVSILAHSSGEWMRGRLTLPALGRDGLTAQACGSSITYARRYSYAAITGCASEDDDGNAASGRGSSEAAQAVAEEKLAKFRDKAAPSAPVAVPALFYTEPAKHNGHYLEFLNIREFLATRQDIEDALRLAFTTHKAKKTKDETVLVPAGELQGLLEDLVGTMGLTVKKLEEGRNA